MFRSSSLLLVVLLAGLTTGIEATHGGWKPGDGASLNALFGADVLASNISQVRRRASELSSVEKYLYLKSWVLPAAAHPDLRLVSEFTPTNPSPWAMELEPWRFPSNRGGELVSPVFDLLDTADELDRLDELRAEVTQLSDGQGGVDARAKLVLLTLICLAQERQQDADELVTQLQQRLVDSFQDPKSDYSGELLLLYDAVVRRQSFELVGDLLGAVHNNRYAIDVADAWESHLCTLMGHYRRHLIGEPEAHEVRDNTFDFWTPVSRSIAMTRGDGYPGPIWHRQSNGELHLDSGHHRDYLFFKSPLAGNYEVAGELDLGGRTQLMTGGWFVGPQGGRKSIEVGKFRSEHLILPVDPQLAPHDFWVRYRAVVRDGRLQVFLEERLLFERELGPDSDPWVAARGIAHSTGPLRHIQISGTPQVPDEIDLSSRAAFSNWYTYYFFVEDAGNPRSIWQWEAGESGRGQIVAKRYPAPRGSSMESVLRYHRPLPEHGEIEYEFFYSPDDVHVHPVLDRLAFVLQPEGVGLHWCTDGKYDRTRVSPDHVIFEQPSQRGSGPLPLIAGDWNHLKLSLAGQTVSLTLNGRLVFHKEVPETNQRTFAFFRFADQTMSRIRSVKMRGDWPRTVPTLAEQEFADPRLVTLESEIADLPAEFQHDFALDGLPEQSFKLTGQQLETAITEEPDGVHVKLSGTSGWTVAALMPQVRISGDFDIRAEVELLDLESGWQDGLAFLEVRLADEENHYVRAMRGYEPDTGQTVRSQVMWGPHDERWRLVQERFAGWASAGCFRVCRSGDRYTSMFAPQGSSVFRVLGEAQIAADAPVEDVLLELAVRHASQGQVVWKNLSIRAEQLE